MIVDLNMKKCNKGVALFDEKKQLYSMSKEEFLKELNDRIEKLEEENIRLKNYINEHTKNTAKILKGIKING